MKFHPAVGIGVLAFVFALSFSSGAQPRRPITKAQALAHTGCPVVEGAPRQSCKKPDACVAVDAKNWFFDCMRADKSRYPAIAVCGVDSECATDETCNADGHCTKVNNRPRSCAPAFPNAYCTNDQLCARDGTCSYTAPSTGAFIAAASVPGCNGGEPCHGTEVCGRTPRCDCPGGTCMTYKTCDNDQDGHSLPSCGGDDCDDNDANRFPGNPETCTAKTATHDEDCNPTTVANARYDINSPNIPWETNMQVNPFADSDKDGFISVGCWNVWSGPKPPERTQLRGLFFDPGTNRITGDDCNDNDTGDNPTTSPRCSADGKSLLRCYGSDPMDPNSELVWPYQVQHCKNGCKNRQCY